MEGYPAIGFITWSCLFWAFGFACGFLADEWKWRRRHLVEQVDAGKAAEKLHRREAAAPFLAELAKLAGILEQYVPGKNRPAPTLIKASTPLRQALAALRPALQPADAERVAGALAHCLDDEACHADAQCALDAVRDLQKLVAHTLDS